MGWGWGGVGWGVMGLGGEECLGGVGGMGRIGWAGVRWYWGEVGLSRVG